MKRINSLNELVNGSSHNGLLIRIILNITLIIVGISSNGSLPNAWGALEGRSLEDCFRASLHQSETIGISQEMVNQAQETYRQAMGAVLPSVVSTASYLKQASPDTGEIARGIFPTSQPNFKVALTQPIFQGFAEYAGLRQTAQLTSAQLEAKKNAMIQLYTSVSTAFHAVLSAEKDLENLTTEIGFYDKRIEELEHRVKIGLNQMTDVLSTRAIVGGLKAQLEQDRGLIAINRETLAFLTGWDAKIPIKDLETYPTELKPVEEYLANYHQRPDVMTNQYQVSAAEENITIARAGHFPTINLVADYYFVRPQGLSQTINWDISANVSLPLFSGGITQARIRSATSVAQQSALTLSQTQRQAIQQIRTYHATLTADLAQVTAYESATRIAEKNYYEEVRNYRLGLVTNIDVLTALSTFQEDNRLYDKTKFIVKQDLVNLELASLKRRVFDLN